VTIVTSTGARRDRSGSERGAVAVEFALILPVLVLLVFGAIEFGRVLSQYQVFQGAAREGARCAAVQDGEAAVGLPVCDVRERIESATGSYTASLSTLSVEVDDGNGSPYVCSGRRGENVHVSWTQPLDVTIPFWRDTTITTTIEGVFRCE
jgi:Flp pilus assembly protein TadG